MKICSNKKCVFAGLLQPLDNFYKDRTGRGKGGLRADCKWCVKFKCKKYVETHKKEKIAYWNMYNRTHKQEIRHRSKIYNEANKEKIQLKNKNYYEKNKQSIRLQQNKYEKKRRQEDIDFKIRKNLRRRLLHAIESEWKTGSAIEDLGCSVEQLKEKFVSMFVFIPEVNEAMTWNNYGILWEIDHIIPLSFFDLTKREELVKACHFSNLRPMWISQNRSENDRGMSRRKRKRINV